MSTSSRDDKRRCNTCKWYTQVACTRNRDLPMGLCDKKQFHITMVNGMDDSRDYLGNCWEPRP